MLIREWYSLEAVGGMELATCPHSGKLSGDDVDQPILPYGGLKELEGLPELWPAGADVRPGVPVAGALGILPVARLRARPLGGKDVSHGPRVSREV